MKTRSSLILLTLLLAIALPAAAQSLDWTMVGSAGVSDNANPNFLTAGPAVYIASNVVDTLEFRYPVTNTYGSATSKQPGWTTFSMTYADNHATGTIVANLMEVDACSSTERQLCSLTSVDGDGSTECDTCSLSSGLDFSNHSYYVYVTITKTDLPADPRLFELALY
jgi:hypothetical protein